MYVLLLLLPPRPSLISNVKWCNRDESGREEGKKEGRAAECEKRDAEEERRDFS